MMVHKVAYLVKAYNILASLVINIHQTKIHLVPKCRERTWKKRGSKYIHVVRVEDNRQIIIVISFAIDGSLLPLQVIFIKSTTRCLLQNGLGGVRKVSCSFDTFC
jgi:hypothetical protein